MLFNKFVISTFLLCLIPSAIADSATVADNSTITVDLLTDNGFGNYWKTKNEDNTSTTSSEIKDSSTLNPVSNEVENSFTSSSIPTTSSEDISTSTASTSILQNSTSSNESAALLTFDPYNILGSQTLTSDTATYYPATNTQGEETATSTLSSTPGSTTTATSTSDSSTYTPIVDVASSEETSTSVQSLAATSQVDSYTFTNSFASTPTAFVSNFYTFSSNGPVQSTISSSTTEEAVYLSSITDTTTDALEPTSSSLYTDATDTSPLITTSGTILEPSTAVAPEEFTIQPTPTDTSGIEDSTTNYSPPTITTYPVVTPVTTQPSNNSTVLDSILSTFFPVQSSSITQPVEESSTVLTTPLYISESASTDVSIVTAAPLSESTSGTIDSSVLSELSSDSPVSTATDSASSVFTNLPMTSSISIEPSVVPDISVSTETSLTPESSVVSTFQTSESTTNFSSVTSESAISTLLSTDTSIESSTTPEEITPSQVQTSYSIDTTEPVFSTTEPTFSTIIASQTSTSSSIGQQPSADTAASETLSTLLSTAISSASTTMVLSTSATSRATESWLPTYIIADSSATTSSQTAENSVTTTSGAAIVLPKAIVPTQTATPVADYELITIGFAKALNYAFIVQSPISSAQIIQYLPKALASAFSGLDLSSIIVKKLVPYSSGETDYIITVAEVYFDKQYIAQLQEAILDSTSAFHSSSDPTVYGLVELIDPRIPIEGLISTLNAESALNNADSNTSYSSDESITNLVKSLGSIDSVAMSASTIRAKKKTSSKKYIIGVVIGCIAGVVLYIIGIVYFFRKLRKRNVSNTSTVDNASSFSDDSFVYNENQLKYSNSEGDIRLDANSNSNSQPRSNNASLSSLNNIISFFKSGEQPKYAPEISAPINVKSSLGW